MYSVDDNVLETSCVFSFLTLFLFLTYMEGMEDNVHKSQRYIKMDDAIFRMGPAIDDDLKLIFSAKNTDPF